jgi:hypothetical protein
MAKYFAEPDQCIFALELMRYLDKARVKQGQEKDDGFHDQRPANAKKAPQGWVRGLVACHKLNF